MFEKLMASLSAPMAAALTETVSVARRHRMPLYLVGGSVRDLLLDRAQSDVDLAVEGDATGLAQEVARASKARLVIHPRFGTATLRLSARQTGSPDVTLDLAQTRDERYERPGALPTVCPATIDHDLARRDFTVNAMALALTGKAPGSLLDPHGGQRDLASRHLRVLHDRSFQDDATRMLRGLRYEGRLGFRFKPITERLLRRDLSYLDAISGPRLRRELLAILGEERPERILMRAQALGVLRALHPALSLDRRRVAAFTAAHERGLTSLVEVYVCLLTAEAEQAQVEGAILRLALHGAWTRVLRDAVHLREETSQLSAPDLRPSQVVAILEHFSVAAVAARALLQPPGAVRDHLWQYLDRWRYRRPALRGQDLQTMGIEPGPAMGRILAQLRAARLDGEARGREDEVKLVHAWRSASIPT